MKKSQIAISLLTPILLSSLITGCTNGSSSSKKAPVVLTEAEQVTFNEEFKVSYESIVETLKDDLIEASKKRSFETDGTYNIGNWPKLFSNTVGYWISNMKYVALPDSAEVVNYQAHQSTNFALVIGQNKASNAPHKALIAAFTASNESIDQVRTPIVENSTVKYLDNRNKVLFDKIDTIRAGNDFQIDRLQKNTDNPASYESKLDQNWDAFKGSVDENVSQPTIEYMEESSIFLDETMDKASKYAEKAKNTSAEFIDEVTEAATIEAKKLSEQFNAELELIKAGEKELTPEQIQKVKDVEKKFDGEFGDDN